MAREGFTTVHVSISKLGSRASDGTAAAQAVVQYLTGQQDRPAGQQGAASPELARGGETPGSYYADSAQAPGRWHGRGAEEMIPVEDRDRVDPLMLERVLLGQDPVTGEQLVGANGSAGRSSHQSLDHVEVAATGPSDELLTAEQAAKLIGVEKRYVTGVAKRTADHRSRQAMLLDASEEPPLPASFLEGHKVVGTRQNVLEWRFERGEVERFKATRKQPDVVLGYDITFSVPKSISIAWAGADKEGRAVIENALHSDAVGAAMGYLEETAISVRRGRGQERAEGMIAASFMHETSRELEPQLHVHVVVANMAKGADGRTQALDGRDIYAHTTTAGHLAEAEIQSVLGKHGYAFTDTHRGIAHLVDVPQAAVDSLSTRRAQIMAEVGAVGVNSPAARQLAAYATRAAKVNTVDRETLTETWLDRLAETGMGQSELAQLTNHPPLTAWTPEDTMRLRRYLSSTSGVTEKVAIFDRRHVIESITDRVGGRLNAEEILAHADGWLGTEAAIPLRTVDGVTGDLIGDHGAVTLTPGVTYYSTPQMIRVEQAIKDGYRSGHNAGTGTIEQGTVSDAIAQWQRNTGFTLGEDQTAMVRSITGSGDRFQAVVGPAGSGKTAALEVAARAWERAGYRLYGVSVNGNAAQVLEQSSGIESTTVASFLKRFEDPTKVLDSRSVVIVDEASTLGNRQHHQLVSLVERSAATMRTIGDPAQHGAVEAGGMWAHLVELYPDRVAHLTENRRMKPDTMADVRDAVSDFRDGHIGQALDRLSSNDRMIAAGSSGELLEALTADWYTEWQRHLDSPHDVKPSRMMAEHHSARRELNLRAQAALRADGILEGNGVELGDSTFHVGDQVIARAQNRSLKPDGGDRDSYVRNGTKGTVIAIDDSEHSSLVVDFENRGPIDVPNAWLTEELRPGVEGGLAPAYAMTTHAAQGGTFAAALPLVTDRSSPEAVYVAITRGEEMLQMYTVDSATLAEPSPAVEHGLPVVTDERTLEDRIEAQLTKRRTTELATVADRHIAEVAELMKQPLAQLDTIDSPQARRAIERSEQLAFNRVVADPPAPLVEFLGHRDPAGAQRWDSTASDYALYHQRWNEQPTHFHVAQELPSDAPIRQRHDFDRLKESMIDARANQHRHMAPPQLARVRATIVADIAKLQPRDQQTQDATITQLKKRITDLEADIAHHHDRLSAAHTARSSDRNPSATEQARRDLSRAQEAHGAAQAHLRHIQALDRLTPATALACERQRIELAVVDKVIEFHVADALATPQEYRQTAIGHRPDTPEAAQRWDYGAAAIESYRIGQLGRSTQSGPVSEAAVNRHPLTAAIGARPSDVSDAALWDRTRAAVNAANEYSRARTRLRSGVRRADGRGPQSAVSGRGAALGVGRR